MDVHENSAGMYPVMLDLRGRDVLVVGGGPVAERRVGGLLECHASVTVVALAVTEELAHLAESGLVVWLRRPFVPADVSGRSLVFTATGDADVDAAVSSAVRAEGVWVNGADDLPASDFHVPAITRRGPVTIAVGTAGSAPALAVRIRDRIALSLGPEWGRLADALADVRKMARRDIPDRDERAEALCNAAHDPQLLSEVARGLDVDPAVVLDRARDPLPKLSESRRSFVSLVGAGPGAPDLLTLAAYDRLLAADVVVYDDLVNPAVLDSVSVEAQLVYAGKRGWRESHGRPGPETLVHFALSEGGKRVVRLKGGDPNVFGRSLEEIEALECAGIPYEIVPGVTAALAAAASARVPLTARGIAGSVTLATGVAVSADGGDGTEPTPADIASLVRAGSTVAVYMGLRVLPSVTAALADAGVAPDLPVVVVSSASLQDERVVEGRLAEIADRVSEAGLTSPALLIAGSVAARRIRPIATADSAIRDHAQALPLLDASHQATRSEVSRRDAGAA